MFAFLRKATSYTIRPIGPSAAGVCARLHATAFAHPWSAAEFESLLAARNTVGDGALARGANLIGFALSRHAAGEAEILSIAVAKSERGKGVGRDLMNAHLARLAATGVTSVFLEVEPGNASAIALYRRLGFEAVGERKGYYRKVGASAAPALTLRCDLG
ncbi:MAG: [ribosomal protein S18]-alanine N-acetyltransferase [Methylobacteriaceae bacterium]|jgi:ribosomal-protein-alanine N-acetyltransferase|nr:[ribosomal protein S18]-alanine N-acetyltransferase [Methylobacteriaceae bacterium]